MGFSEDFRGQTTKKSHGWSSCCRIFHSNFMGLQPSISRKIWNSISHHFPIFFWYFAISRPFFLVPKRPWSRPGCPANAECLAEDQGLVPGAEPAGGQYQVGAKQGDFGGELLGFLWGDLGTIGIFSMEKIWEPLANLGDGGNGMLDVFWCVFLGKR